MKMILYSLCIFFPTSAFSQSSAALFDLFEPMPEMITNTELRALAENTKPIPEDFYGVLRHRTISPIYPLAKLETKKGMILFYADLKNALSASEEDLITVNSIAFMKRSSKEIAGSSMSYLTMSGDDALYREGEISFNGKEILFRTQNFESKGGSLKETTIEVYELGKKGLEFVSKTTD